MKLLWLYDILETDRCILKIPEESDAQEMWNLVDDQTTKFMPWDKCTSLEDQKKHIIQRRYEVLESKWWSGALYLKSGEMIGSFWFPRIREDVKTGEIGYWLATKYWGQGYIPEAVQALKKYVFESLDWENLTIRANIENINSCKVAEKCNFHKDGILRKDEFSKGKFEDMVYYSFTREDYFSQK